MPERLTLDEIIEKYPDQWVALDDAIFSNGVIGIVRSAVVVCGIPDSEYSHKRSEFMLAGKDYTYIRTSDPDAQDGVYVCAD